MKKIVSFILCLVLLVTGTVLLTACVTDTGEKDLLKVGLVTDIGGFGDKGYNDASLEGLVKAKADLGIEYTAVESKEVSDYITNLETLSESGHKLIITTGAAFSEAVKEVAPKYPDIHYVVLEATITDMANVTSTVSKEHEGGFLLGYLAAKISTTGKLGFISAIVGPAFERFEVGYKAGALSANADIEVVNATIGNFTDINKGKETATMMYSQGVDYIATVAGGVNQGVFQAAVENNKFVFGAATGQFSLSPTNIIASQVKLVNNQVYTLVSEAAKDNFPPAGLFRSGLKEGLVDLLYNPEPTAEMSALLTSELMNKIAEIKTKIIDGTITVPDTFETLETFVAPKL